MGIWSRQITLPVSKVSKTYLVHTLFDVEESAEILFALGLFLSDQRITLRPAVLKRVGPKVCRVTLHEGRQHQVKRMFYEIGNKVIELHRERIGHLELDSTLLPGQWRHLTQEERLLFLSAEPEPTVPIPTATPQCSWFMSPSVATWLHDE